MLILIMISLLANMSKVKLIHFYDSVGWYSDRNVDDNIDRYIDGGTYSGVNIEVEI